MSASPSWDPALYLRFERERARPWHDLVARLDPARPPRTIVDLGCGPGHLTATLAERWPDATITGVDSAPEMIAKAAAHGRSGRLHFVEDDMAQWRPEQPVDLIISNA